MRFKGFEPVFDSRSGLLILGSFPSVKSRDTGFFYGNRQNRFWRTLYSVFGYGGENTESKKAFLLKNGIALWDIVDYCEIEGSGDADIKNYSVADLSAVLSTAPIERIILNGKKAFEIFKENYKELEIPAVCLPSTSPQNTRFDLSSWEKELKIHKERIIKR